MASTPFLKWMAFALFCLCFLSPLFPCFPGTGTGIGTGRTCCDPMSCTLRKFLLPSITDRTEIADGSPRLTIVQINAVSKESQLNTLITIFQGPSSHQIEPARREDLAHGKRKTKGGPERYNGSPDATPRADFLSRSLLGPCDSCLRQLQNAVFSSCAWNGAGTTEQSGRWYGTSARYGGVRCTVPDQNARWSQVLWRYPKHWSNRTQATSSPQTGCSPCLSMAQMLTSLSRLRADHAQWHLRYHTLLQPAADASLQEEVTCAGTVPSAQYIARYPIPIHFPERNTGLRL